MQQLQDCLSCDRARARALLKIYRLFVHQGHRLLGGGAAGSTARSSVAA